MMKWGNCTNVVFLLNQYFSNDRINANGVVTIGIKLYYKEYIKELLNGRMIGFIS